MEEKIKVHVADDHKILIEGIIARYQIRLMMGVLVELGKHKISLDFIINSLKEDNDRKFLRTIAPGSGLQLYDIKFG